MMALPFALDNLGWKCLSSEQTLGGIPLGLGMVMKINFLNFHVHTPVRSVSQSAYTTM